MRLGAEPRPVSCCVSSLSLFVLAAAAATIAAAAVATTLWTSYTIQAAASHWPPRSRPVRSRSSLFWTLFTCSTSLVRFPPILVLASGWRAVSQKASHFFFHLFSPCPAFLLPCCSLSRLSCCAYRQEVDLRTCVRTYIHSIPTYIHTYTHTYTCARVRQLWKKSRISRKRSPLDLDITQESWTTPKARTPLPRTPKAERQGN